MTEHKIRESFQWMAAPEFKIVNTGKNTVTIKGVAVKKGQVSRNKRKYVGEELHSAARTFIGVPVTINHAPYDKRHPMYDGRKVVGNCRWMEYEDNQMEYQIDVNKQPYVDMIRNRSVEVQGVSIEADYLANRCAHCGKDFYSIEEFKYHMEHEEFIKNYNYEPRGMRGRAVSIVFSPEEAGVLGTTIELMEKYQRPKFKPFLQLLETVVTYRKEANKYLKSKTKDKAVIQPESRQVFNKQLKEQEDPTQKGLEPATHSPEDATADCGEGMHRDPETNMCVADDVPTDQKTTSDPPATKSTTETVCASGFILDPNDPQGNTCILAPLPKSDPPTDAPKMVPEPTINIPKVDVTTPAPAGTATETVADTEPPLVPELKHGFEPTPHPAPDDKTKCPQGTHFDAEVNTCVPDEVAEAPTTTAPTGIIPKVTVETLPKLLKLGEPFAGYDNHADCVAKNPNKDDPDAWCADAKRKAEGGSTEEIKESLNIYETQKAIKQALAKVDRKAFINDVKLAETINRINTAVAKVVTNGRHTKTSITKLVKAVLSEAKLRHAYDRGTAKLIFDKLGQVAASDLARAKALGKTVVKLGETQNTTVTEVNKQFTTISKAQKTSATQINKGFTVHKKALGNLATESAKTKKLVVEQQKTIGNLTKSLTESIKRGKEHKRDYEKILTIADRNIEEYKTKVKTLEDWKKAKEQDDAKPEPCPSGQHRDPAGKCVPDVKTEETKKLEEMATDIENLKAKLKGQFKGVNKPLKETTTKGEYYKDPLKTKPKKGK